MNIYCRFCGEPFEYEELQPECNHQLDLFRRYLLDALEDIVEELKTKICAYSIDELDKIKAAHEDWTV